MAKLELLSRKGLSAVGMAVAIVLVSTTLIVGVWIFTTVQSSVNQAGWTASANTTFTNIVSTTWSSFQLGVVSLIVIAAVAIIGILVSGFGRAAGPE